MRLSNKRAAALSLSLLLLCAAGCDRAPRAPSGAEPTAQNQPAGAGVKSPLPPPTGFVNDYAGVFSPESKARLEAVLTELKEKSAVEFAVVTVETTGGQPISDYSLAVMRAWGVGPSEGTKGGGLLLMLAVKDGTWWIQTGRKMVRDLPDELCKELGERSTELYRQGKYAEGITRYVKALVEKLEEARGFRLSGRL